MSRKVDTFKTIIPLPQLACNYTVWMPLAPMSMLLCSECEIPQERFVEDIITINGQPVYIPTRAQVSGTWECTFDEGIIPVAYPSILWLKGLVNSNAAVISTDTAFFNKHVKTLFTNSLKQVAIQMTSLTTFVPAQDIVVSLMSNSAAVGNNSVFNVSLAMPIYSVILKGAWLQEITPIQLGADKSTQPVKYRLKFRFSAIKSTSSI